MKTSWNLPEARMAIEALAERVVEVVLVEFDGPQIVVVWGPGGSRRLAIACDEDETAVRWLEAELSASQWGRLFDGLLSLRDALLQPRVWIVDQTHSGKALHGWECSSADLAVEILPEVGALLPTAVRQQFAGGPSVAPVELSERDAAVARGFPTLARMVA